MNDVRNGTSCIQYDENAGKMPGFNWIDAIFDTHFHARGRLGRAAEVLIDLKRLLSIGLDENTAFFYENGQGKVFGEHGVTILDISDAVKLQSKFFQLTNAKIHYLTEGDRYDFKSKVVTSSKSLITTPQFKNNTDSDDIFAPYECSLLLTRLVDQTAVLNRGKSTIPDGYPKDAPVFELTFSKNAQTKGYRRGDAYTVVNAVLDYSYISDETKPMYLRSE
jgi:cyanophycinase